MAESTSTAYLLGRIRKAIVAGASAGVAAAFALILPLNGGSGMLDDGKVDATEAGTLVGAFFTAAVPAGFLAWRIPNALAKHDSTDAAVAAAVREVQNVGLPTITAADVAAVSTDAPTDAALPAPGDSAAGTGMGAAPKPSSGPEHRA